MVFKHIFVVSAAMLCLALAACGSQGGTISTTAMLPALPASTVLAEQETAAESTASDSFSMASTGTVATADLPGVYLADTETAIISAINAEREALGLGTLTVNEKLTQAARIRSEELCRAGHWDHTRPNGDAWSTVLKDDVPFSFLSAGENLATVTHNNPHKQYEKDANWWFTEWKNSPTHYDNMILEEFMEVGVGIYFEERDDDLKVAYATTLFAKTEAPKQ